MSHQLIEWTGLKAKPRWTSQRIRLIVPLLWALLIGPLGLAGLWLIHNLAATFWESYLITAVLGSFIVAIAAYFALHNYRLRASEHVARLTVDALSAHIAILDQKGRIIAVNKSWRDFAHTNATSPQSLGEATNYLAVCDAANGKDAEDAHAFAAGIRAIIAGEQEEFSLQYSCHSPLEQRWFIGRVRRFPSEGPTRIVVAHENITARKQAEEALQNSLEQMKIAYDQAILYGRELGGEILERKRAEAALRESETHNRAIAEDQTELEKRLKAIYQLGQELTFLHDQAAIIQRVLKTVADVLHFEMVGCGLVNEAAGELEYRYYLISGALGNIRLCLPLTGPEALSIGAAVIRSGQALNIPDATKNIYIPFLADWPSRAALCVPIKSDQHNLGVLNVESLEPNHFTSDDQQLLQALADQAAVALENARLYNSLQQWADEQTALNTISQAINATLDLQETLTLITSHTTHLLNATAASVALRDETKGDLWFAAASGDGAEAVLGMRLAMGRGLVGWVIQQGQPILAPDVSQDTRFNSDFDRMSGFTTHSLLCVPLQTKGQTIGAIEVMNKVNDPFNQEDLRLLTSLAASAATAIENAWLFKAEQRQHEIATILAEVVASVSLDLSTDELLDQILLKLRQLLEYDSASIFLIKDNQLVIEAACGFERTIISDQHAISQDVLFQEMLSRRGHILIQDTRADARYQHWQGAEKVLAWVGAPLLVAQEVSGYLAVDRYLPGAFSTADADLIQAFAHQVAQTIYNARLFADLMETRAQLIQRERLAAVGQMAATVAHDLRNPLMAIRAGVEYLLYDVSVDDARWEGAALMRASIGRIDRIVENILFISRSPRPSLTPGLLRPLIEGELARWHLALSEKNIRYSLHLADDLPPILLDPDQMGRALSNLIDNSVEVLAPGGELCLRLTFENQRQVISLTDNGPGILAEHVSKIFEPFFTTKSRGTGLGLSIVKQIIDYHQGDITVWSETGVGTRFTITLPLGEFQDLN